MTRKEMVALLSAAGCTDGGCPIAPPGGMRTNGGCHCFEGLSPDVRRRLRALARLLRELVLRVPDGEP